MINEASIDTPHPDIELGYQRKPINFRYALPSTQKEQAMGLIFYIHGYGGHYKDGYTDSFLPYLAETYHCMAVAVEYFGSGVYAYDINSTTISFSSNIVDILTNKYGVNFPADIPLANSVPSALRALANQGVERLDDEIIMYTGVYGYHSFGLLPALDHLQVLNTILQLCPIDKKRLYVIGSSYGGHIALMLAKLAPNTFRMIVDNSGFSSPSDNTQGVLGFRSGIVTGNLKCNKRSQFHWDNDKNSPNFFGEHHHLIRSMLIDEHITPSQSRVFSYHSCCDHIADTESKKEMLSIWPHKMPFTIEIIDESKVDGRLFKNLSHGMNASLRTLFDLSHAQYIEEQHPACDFTDFDLQTQKVFTCGNYDYTIQYKVDGVTLALAKK